MKILIPGAGNKILHIKNFQELDDVDKVIITDIYPWTYGGMVADSAYITPGFDSPDFFPAIDKIYQKEHFDILIPIHDSSLMLFSKNRDYLSKMPYRTVMNKVEVVNVIADKLKTYEFLTANGFDTPETFSLSEHLETCSREEKPFFVKPRYIDMRGTSRQLFMKIEDKIDYNYVEQKLSGHHKDYVVQEFIEGDEVNVDIFCDLNGYLKSVTSLYRQDMGKSRGISRGEIFVDEEIDTIASKVCEKIHLIGANQIQLFKTRDGRYLITEINGRFSGSSVFVKAAGVNFFHYFVEMVKGNKIEIKEKARKLKMNSWESPFFYTESIYQLP